MQDLNAVLRRTPYDASRRARWVLAMVAVLVKAVAACTVDAVQPLATVPAKLSASPMSANPEETTLEMHKDLRANHRVQTYFLDQSDTSSGPCTS